MWLPPGWNTFNQPSIRARRLILRKPSETDTLEFARWQMDIRANSFDALPKQSVQEVKQAILHALNPNTQYWIFAIERIADSRVIGELGIQGVAEMRNTCGVWIKLDPFIWGGGYGSEALASLLSWTGNNTYWDTVVADVADSNIASQKMCQHVGLQLAQPSIYTIKSTGVTFDSHVWIKQLK